MIGIIQLQKAFQWLHIILLYECVQILFNSSIVEYLGILLLIHCDDIFVHNFVYSIYFFNDGILEVEPLNQRVLILKCP